MGTLPNNLGYVFVPLEELKCRSDAVAQKHYRTMIKLIALGLTRRQAEVGCLIRMGLKNQAIADQLCITRKCVAAHNTVIFEKLKVKNRLKAILKIGAM